MPDSQRTWLRWAGTLIGVVVAAFGVRTMLVQSAVSCRAGGTAYLCTARASTHPHAVLGLVVLVTGLGILAASRHYLSYFG
jgi:uncharacterized membrane protein YidH (DUF202 family)